MLAQAPSCTGNDFLREMAGPVKGNDFSVSNVDYYEVIRLGAIDQNEKSILNGKIMQHAAKGKDLRTIPKSRNLQLRAAIKEEKIK